MADDGYTSPFPTTHDTVGTSTLATPLFMPSSPPRKDSISLGSPTRPRSRLSDRLAVENEARPSKNRSQEDTRASTPEGLHNDLDARLAEYDVDFSGFPSAQFALDDQDPEPLPELNLPREDDKLSEVGGPDDFTLNMEKYLFGDRSVPKKEEMAIEEENEEQGEEEEETDLRQASKLRQPAVEDEHELEYSEFEPPVDMSTPSHLLRRTGGAVKDATPLEDIEEDPADGLDEARTPATTPCLKKPKRASSDDKEETQDDLRQQIVDLKKAVQERDEQLQKNRRRVLEAASAGEQIKHLQTELQKKSTLLDEIHAQRSDGDLLREQIHLLQKQNAEKETMLQKSTLNVSEISTLQKQISSMQMELQNRNTHSNLDAERLETITHLRQQLNVTQEQLRKRDAALEETIAKLKEVTTAKELQLREKNSEIDELKAQIDDQLLDIEKLEADLDQANEEYQALEHRISSLEDQNRPLEEKNISLKADLTRAQTEMMAQQDALKAVAADLPIEAGGGTYTEILELIKDLHQPNPGRIPEPLSKESKEQEIEQLRQEIAKLQTELKEANSARQSQEMELTRFQEQATETRALINSIESENSRLTARVIELNSSVEKAQTELSQVRREHSEALATVERFQRDKNVQQPSPPPSPQNLNTSNQKTQVTVLEEPHQAQLKSLQTAHATAISTLRASHAESTRKLRNLLAAAEKRESQLQAELQSIRASTSSQNTQVETLNAEIKRLQSIIAIKDETAAALDQRIARSVEKREKEWERRVDLLLKERDRMGKALMWTWGEKEVPNVKEIDEDGRRVKQGYRYKYAQKSAGKKKSEEA